MLRVRAMKVSFHETLNDPQTPVHQVRFHWNSDGRPLLPEHAIYMRRYCVSNPPENQISSSQKVRWASSHDTEYLLLKLTYPNQLPHQSCQISEIEEDSGRFLDRGLSDRPLSCPPDSDDAWLREFYPIGARDGDSVILRHRIASVLVHPACGGRCMIFHMILWSGLIFPPTVLLTFNLSRGQCTFTSHVWRHSSASDDRLS